MQNTIQNFLRFIVFKKPVWKIERFDELQPPETWIIFVEILHTFPTS